jgi:hypothetical protein
MEFNDAAKNRINTYNWTTKIPTVEEITKLVEGIHSYVPSKQKRVRFKIAVIPAHSMPELQFAIYESTYAQPNSINGRYNPQVLAPWLLAFSPGRGKHSLEPGLEPGRPDIHTHYEMGLDIGLAAMYTSLAAKNMGMDSGFCGCIQDTVAVEPIIGSKPSLYIGIGYRDPSKQYHCPIYDKMVDIPGSDADLKPDKELYITYV